MEFILIYAMEDSYLGHNNIPNITTVLYTIQYSLFCTTSAGVARSYKGVLPAARA